MMRALDVQCIAEKALIYLYSEENVLSADQLRYLAGEIGADMSYINERLAENGRLPV